MLFALLALPALVLGAKTFTEAELAEHTGADGDTIYLAINGTVYDVSASPRFYGPGGHYHHFVGKDATRAWVTECWDTPDQITWRMDGIEAMFIPKYLDEEVQKAAIEGFSEDNGDAPELALIPREQIQLMAQKVVDRFGELGKQEKAKRREQDIPKAKEAMNVALKHWIDFFANNDKYSVVGTVELDSSNPDSIGHADPPRPCTKAMAKRPMEGGRLEGLMNAAAPMGGMGGANAPHKAAPTGKDVPEHVRKRIEERNEQVIKEEEAKKASGAKDEL